MADAALQAPPMTVEEFLDWTEARPDERYELVDGEVVLQARDNARHNVTKMATAIAFDRACRNAGGECRTFIDGMGVSRGARSFRLPDVVVQCGPVETDAAILPQPVIVVEVVSKRSENRDVSEKLDDYFAQPSIQHYLILYPDSRRLIWHRRIDETRLETVIHPGETLQFDPPGLSIQVADLFGDL